MSQKTTNNVKFNDQSPVNAINEVAARIAVFPTPTEAFQSGSCCRIAKNLYITASHVILDWIEKFGTSQQEQNFEIWAIHVRNGPEYSIWVVDRIWTCPFSDLAIMHTKPYNDVAANEKDTKSPKLNLIPPNINDQVNGFGHYSPDQSIIVDGEGTRHIKLNGKGAATIGEVKEIHLEKRDTVRLPFPCFRINARFEGGMSGGPIFNKLGHLCGLICSSMPPTEDFEEHVSYATLLWPLMGTMINILPSGSISNTPYPLLELAQKGIIHALGHERVKISKEKNGNVCQIQFT